MRRNWIILTVLSLAAMVVMGCTAVSAAEEGSPAVPVTPHAATAITVLTFDLAEDFTRFALDPEQINEEGIPAHGTPFITQGYLYPEGTLDESSVGVNADGSPEFPDKVIGTWICRGWVLGDAMGMDGSPAAITTQTFHLGPEYDDAVIVSEGYEYITPDGPFVRAITGGTGLFRTARGEQIQEVLNINEYMGMVMRLQLHLETQ